MDEQTCRNAIRRRLDEGALPHDSAQRLWASHGRGQICSGCGQPIEPHEILYELEVPTDASHVTLSFHRACCEVWNRERRIPPAAVQDVRPLRARRSL